MFIEFCERNGLIVTNTWFKKPKRRLYIWKAPGDWSRHQLDYILVKHRFRNSVKDVQTQPSKTGYRRKDKGRDGSDKKTRKKT